MYSSNKCMVHRLIATNLTVPGLVFQMSPLNDNVRWGDTYITLNGLLFSCDMSSQLRPNPSRLEVFLVRGTRHAPGFISSFFDRLSPDGLLMLGKTARLLRCLVQCYSSSVWNIEQTLGLWFPRVDLLRKVLDACGAIVGGRAVFDFFDRRRNGASTLRVFTQMSGVLRIGNFLLEAGYDPYDDHTGYYAFSSAAFAMSLHARASAFASHPDRTDPPLAEFPFMKRVNANTGYVTRVVLCVVRPDPVRFVLSLPHSKYCCIPPFETYLISVLYHFAAGAMNFLTSTFAVSLFPYSTFVDGVGYSCGLPTAAIQDDAWNEACNIDSLTLSNGRREELTPNIVSQNRGIGDRKSWLVRIMEPDSYQQEFPTDEEYILGMKFDILDWTMYHKANGACMVISDPHGISYVIHRLQMLQ